MQQQSQLGLRLLEHFHGHLALLATLALVHPAILLQKRARPALLSASLGTGLVTLAGLLGALLYAPYRQTIKPQIFAASAAVGNLFERKEHLGVAVVVLAWVGLVAHMAEARERFRYASGPRIAPVAYLGAATLAAISAALGIAVSVFKTF
jgi:hypothetical protein